MVLVRSYQYGEKVFLSGYRFSGIAGTSAIHWHLCGASLGELLREGFLAWARFQQRCGRMKNDSRDELCRGVRERAKR
ncbi:hypothetical protein [Candidatus Methylacidithermus pantelleriae]|uniref:hypothetical protein n=1 Tax=Candidatus Methylacidithermus pantelleriae TaxID=2744239 RepID=UPI001BD41EB3|nr:hypothetical protein [Candidatus Methylacidithermus pantelleriae]